MDDDNNDDDRRTDQSFYLLHMHAGYGIIIPYMHAHEHVQVLSQVNLYIPQSLGQEKQTHT